MPIKIEFVCIQVASEMNTAWTVAAFSDATVTCGNKKGVPMPIKIEFVCIQVASEMNTAWTVAAAPAAGSRLSRVRSRTGRLSTRGSLFGGPEPCPTVTRRWAAPAAGSRLSRVRSRTGRLSTRGSLFGGPEPCPTRLFECTLAKIAPVENRAGKNNRGALHKARFIAWPAQLSNGYLNAPWPKSRLLKTGLEKTIEAHCTKRVSLPGNMQRAPRGFDRSMRLSRGVRELVAGLSVRCRRPKPPRPEICNGHREGSIVRCG